VAIGIAAGVQGYLSEGLGFGVVAGVVWFGIALAVLSLLRKS